MVLRSHDFKCYDTLPTESVLFLFVVFEKPIRVSRVSKLANGFDCTNRAPAFARSFDVPLCNAVFNHFTSDGLPKNEKNVNNRTPSQILLSYFSRKTAAHFQSICDNGLLTLRFRNSSFPPTPRQYCIPHTETTNTRKSVTY